MKRYLSCFLSFRVFYLICLMSSIVFRTWVWIVCFYKCAIKGPNGGGGGRRIKKGTVGGGEASCEHLANFSFSHKSQRPEIKISFCLFFSITC